MDNQTLLLSAKMLELASDQFSNHGCNDLDDDIKGCISDPKALCQSMREWMGDDEWPQDIEGIGDDQLMKFLSDAIMDFIKGS